MRTTLGIGLALLLTGCGSLRVEVSVLDPTTVEQEVDRRLIREMLPLVLGQTDLAVKQSIIDVQNDHFAFLVRLSENYLAAAKSAKPSAKLILTAQAEGLQRSMARWKKIYETAQGQLLAIRAEVDKLSKDAATAGTEEAKNYQARIAEKLRLRNQVQNDLRHLVELEIGERLAEANAAIHVRQEARDAASQAVVTAKKSLVAGQGLVEDPYAYTVASADEKLWAPRFNTVIGRGTFGNFNMAVKMEDLGDFTLKGLTFDPSDVAHVAGKVTTQALLLASQIAGVPIRSTSSGSTTPENGDALMKSSNRLAEAQDAQELEDSKIQAHQDGLMSLALTVLREWPSLNSDSQRAEGIAAIKSAFTANHARLKMEPAPTTPEEPADNITDDSGTDASDGNSQTGGTNNDSNNDAHPDTPPPLVP